VERKSVKTKKKNKDKVKVKYKYQLSGVRKNKIRIKIITILATEYRYKPHYYTKKTPSYMGRRFYRND